MKSLWWWWFEKFAVCLPTHNKNSYQPTHANPYPLGAPHFRNKLKSSKVAKWRMKDGHCVCVCGGGGCWQKKTMDKRCILRHFKPFCKSCFLTLLPPKVKLRWTRGSFFRFSTPRLRSKKNFFKNFFLNLTSPPPPTILPWGGGL